MKRPGALRTRIPLVAALGLSTVLALTGCGESHPSDGSEAAEEAERHGPHVPHHHDVPSAGLTDDRPPARNGPT